jgi:transposase
MEAVSLKGDPKNCKSPFTPFQRKDTTMKNLFKGHDVCKRIQLTEDESLHVGLDVHKRSYSVALWSNKFELIGSWSMPSNPDGLMSLIQKFMTRIEKIVYEAGPTGFGLARSLIENHFNCEVISPFHTPRTRDPKSDRIDCRNLAEYSSINKLKAIYIPTLEEESDREVFRVRDQMMANQRRVKCQIQSLLLLHSIPSPKGLKTWSRTGIEELRRLKLMPGLRFKLDVLIDELNHAIKQVFRATQELRRLSQTERYRRDYTLLTSAKGVGLVTAMGFLLEMPNYRRFENKRQVSKMLGLSPKVARSGDTVKELGREEGGIKRLRSLLIEASWRWIRNDSAAYQRYNRYLMNTGSEKKAITAMAHKLGVKLWTMLMTQRPWRPMDQCGPKAA